MKRAGRSGNADAFLYKFRSTNRGVNMADFGESPQVQSAPVPAYQLGPGLLPRVGT